MQYNKINNLLGWLCFVIASVTYILTLESSVSFWDCGEFISCAFRLQVSHQPGYPLFAMLGKAFSLLSLGDNTKVPFFTNTGSALASGATVMFLFWTITALARKIVAKRDEVLDRPRTILIMGAGLVGALAFAYSDTFWFSAVETIVFAWSSFCTAIVFWAILKWDAHADEPGADRWIIFIAYMIGLSIGIHLLNLLTIPAIMLVFYFRRYKNINIKTGIVAFVISIGILGLVQFGIRGYTIQIAAYFDLFFVNSLGMGFGTGAFFFFILLIGILVLAIVYSIRNKKPILNLALLCVAFIYFGYGSFVYIPIRAAANPDLNNSHPDNAFTLYGYLNRIQYGENPLLFGPYFDAKIINQEDGNIIYRKGEQRYEQAGKRQKYIYDHTTFLPRMYTTEQDAGFAQDAQFYRSWLHLGESDSPTFYDNLHWMFTWQMGQMYFRYFLWNFVGRYNQADGQQAPPIDGQWTSGIFDSGKHLPKSVTSSNTYTPLFAIPLVIGLLGLFFHFQHRRRDALVIAFLWFFTGLAIVIYVNQPSIQPRERDYSYVGSFYAFAIWIGLGVMAIAEFARKKLNAQTAAVLSTLVCLLAAPLVMAKEEWKAHDRSTKLTPHDMAYDYLISCPKNAILFTYGDNDTYSLWYDQEVEGVRPDVRIVNLSLFSGDWYIHQMQGKMNESAPLPITMPFKKYEEGVRDVIFYDDKKIQGPSELKEVFDFITSDDPQTKEQTQSGESVNFLPTKFFKITINPAEVVKEGVVPADQKDRIAPTMEWKFPGSYITKDNLAMLDILAHNDWKRPICFAITVGQENLIGLQPYLYKEGFAYRLIPFKPDTAINAREQLSKVNGQVMYDNIMDKFRWGNYKHARYLDPESTSMFYPVMTSTFIELIQGLMTAGRNDEALKALHKYDAEMPDIYPYMDIIQSKSELAQMAYRLNDNILGDRIVNSVDEYIVDQLAYQYYLQTSGSSNLDTRDVQMGVIMINQMLQFTTASHRTALVNKLNTQLKDYETKFGSLLNQQQGVPGVPQSQQ
jgi:hypothetical protein